MFMRNNKNLDSGYVYFIQCGDAGPIKIGYSKHESAENRLTVAQVYNPFLLTLLCVMPGGRRKEAELHECFSKFQILGEWFSSNEDLLKIIASQKYLGLTTKDFQRVGPAHNNHYAWQGDEATDESKRSRAARRYSVEGIICQRCEKLSAHDRFHKDGNLDNIDPENIMLVCRRCCMELDGRLDHLKALDRSLQTKPPQQCIICRQFKKPLRKGRCHSCNEYYRRHKEDRHVI